MQKAILNGTKRILGFCLKLVALVPLLCFAVFLTLIIREDDGRTFWIIAATFSALATFSFYYIGNNLTKSAKNAKLIHEHALKQESTAQQSPNEIVIEQPTSIKSEPKSPKWNEQRAILDQSIQDAKHAAIKQVASTRLQAKMREWDEEIRIKREEARLDYEQQLAEQYSFNALNLEEYGSDIHQIEQWGDDIEFEDDDSESEDEGSEYDFEDEVDSIDYMEGHDFEYYCADLLLKNGFDDAVVTRGSGDQGVDILAEKDGLRYAIQCKNFASKLSNKPVQEVAAGKIFYNCHVAVVMTNSTLTPGAIELAKATSVVVWDRPVLHRMITAVHNL